MLAGARKATIERVQIHFLVIHHIAANHGALIEVDVIQIIHQSRRIIQVLRGAFAVVQTDRIDDMHRRPGCAKMHIIARQMQIMLGVAGMQGNVARGHGQHILDQRARETQAAIIALNRPRPATTPSGSAPTARWR